MRPLKLKYDFATGKLSSDVEPMVGIFLEYDLGAYIRCKPKFDVNKVNVGQTIDTKQQGVESWQE